MCICVRIGLISHICTYTAYASHLSCVCVCMSVYWSPIECVYVYIICSMVCVLMFVYVSALFVVWILARRNLCTTTCAPNDLKDIRPANRPLPKGKNSEYKRLRPQCYLKNVVFYQFPIKFLNFWTKFRKLKIQDGGHLGFFVFVTMATVLN